MKYSGQLGANYLGGFLLGKLIIQGTTKPELQAYGNRKPVLLAAKGDN